MEPVAWSTSNLYSLELVGCRKLLTPRALKGPGLRDSGKTELVLVANTEMSSGNGGTLLRSPYLTSLRSPYLTSLHSQ